MSSSTTSRSPTTARCSTRPRRISPRAACRCWRSSAPRPDHRRPCGRGIDYLRRTQLRDGSWFGRWGVNYIYGTWSALCALNAAGLGPDSPEMRRAAAWLISIQAEDGGWGEDGGSYRLDYRGHARAPSTPSQTAWALLGLMAAGEAGHPAVARGIEYLLATQERRRFVERARLHRDRLSARLLPALPWLSEILSAVGAGAIPKSQKHQQPQGRVRPVAARARFVVVAVGLEFEARLARAAGARKTSAARPASAMTDALAAAIGPGCAGVLSFGIAGGLDPKLRAGAAIVASSVIGRRPHDRDRRALDANLAELASATRCIAPLLGVDAPVTRTVRQAATCSASTGAAARRYGIAHRSSTCRRHGLPFAAFRVVADAAHRTRAARGAARHARRRFARCACRAARDAARSGGDRRLARARAPHRWWRGRR